MHAEAANNPGGDRGRRRERSQDREDPRNGYRQEKALRTENVYLPELDFFTLLKVFNKPSEKEKKSKCNYCGITHYNNKCLYAFLKKRFSVKGCEKVHSRAAKNELLSAIGQTSLDNLIGKIENDTTGKLNKQVKPRGPGRQKEKTDDVPSDDDQKGLEAEEPEAPETPGETSSGATSSKIKKKGKKKVKK